MPNTKGMSFNDGMSIMTAANGVSNGHIQMAHHRRQKISNRRDVTGEEKIYILQIPTLSFYCPAAGGHR